MFSRRHPFLFTALVFTAIVCSAVIVVSILSFFAGDRGGLDIGGEKVGVVEITGVISDAKPTLDALQRFRENKAIKAIVLRIDSPGGGVGPSQEIYKEILKTRDTKKVIASMGSVAASGGYYVAASADGIMANPGTIVGSIGVIMGFTNLKELFEKIGIDPKVIKAGKYKDIGSPAREMSDAEVELLQNMADDIHNQFITAVAEGRKLAVEKVVEIADGRVFSGRRGQELGLIDRMGNLPDAVQWAGELGGIKGKVNAVYAEPEEFSFLRYLIDSSTQKIIDRIF